MRKAPDLADEGIVIFLHQPPGSVLSTQRVVLVNIDLRRHLAEHLPGDLFLHPEDAVLVDQVTGAEDDFDPSPLLVRGQPLHLCLGKIVPQVRLDLQRRKYVKKRFHIGIEAMEYVRNEIPDSELIIISNLTGIEHLPILVNNLDLGKNIKFNGYSSSPDIFFKNVSLNYFPSISEAFPMVLSEAKIYGIPCIFK